MAEWSYHHLHITTAKIPRARLSGLPYGLWVTCSRVSGWELWDMNRNQNHETLPPSKGALLAGEYAGPDRWLVLDVARYVILDSREPEAEPAPEPEVRHG
jgi:hypothetical protein